MKKAILIVSGGLDSVTLAHWYASRGYELHLIGFNYGQRHKKELEYAARCALRLHATFDQVDLSSLAHLLKGSSLTDGSIEVPDGHYAAPTMASTVVPNRNALMLSVAYAIAVAEQAELVAIGVHAGDHYVYPDCRPNFIGSFETMESYATEGFGSPVLHLEAPFVNIGKHDIVRLGTELQVPYNETWSCYKGNLVHCGTCGTCVERQEAFELAKVADPTIYLTRSKKEA
jgi:7-cyano-7-deazaguanine synthase